jgi:ParB-like chromosome segregation protein Spo0J
MTVLPLDAIKIGKRHRADLGDIKQLAHNIAEIGLLHPIVVTPDGSLIAGACRLMAFRTLGRDTIPVTVVDLERVVLGEYAENTFRKQFTPSECADIADALEPIERAAAKERQLAGKPPGTDLGKGLYWQRRLASRPKRALPDGRARQADRRADKPNHAFAWEAPGKFAEARRVL